MFTEFNAKAQGESHKENDTPCQDAAFSGLSCKKDIGLAVVADGHGGEKYFRSKKGADLAVKIASKVIFDFMGKHRSIFDNKTDEEREEILKGIERKIIFEWGNAVRDDIRGNPFTESEQQLCADKNIDTDNENDLLSIYGTTLIAALVTKSCWFAVQIGDGACVVITKDGNAAIAIPEDERLEFGRTTSLCDADAIDNFRQDFREESILGITVATDGVSDSFIPEKYLEFNVNLLKDFLESENAKQNLENFLPVLSQRGSRDDVSIAGIFNVTEGKRFFDRKRREVPEYCSLVTGSIV